MLRFNVLSSTNFLATFARDFRFIVKTASSNRRLLWFAGCTFCVAAISVHDAVLVVLNDDIIGQVEQNPVGRWLIEQQDGAVWLFVMAKLAGTSIVCAILATLYLHLQQIAMTVANALAAIQLCLLGYLSIG